MTVLKEDFSLRSLHTFGLEASAKFFVSIDNKADLNQVLASTDGPSLVLGGGSNVIFVNDYPGLVLHMQNKGIQIISDDNYQVVVEAQAGENWHQFVQWTVRNDFGGLENLSLIPGTVGAAPIQNIGAYGVEIDMVFDSLCAMRKSDCQVKIFDSKDCQFSYRNSIFKQELKDQYCILSVRFRLSKSKHTLHTHYGRISDEIEAMEISEPTIADVANIVCRIRQSKLPDPSEIGNCGSFFKNPIIDQSQLLDWKKEFPTVPYYRLSDDKVKVPGGWIIDQLGWRGKSRGGAAVFKNHALVLINKDGATGSDLLQLIEDINDSVQKTFDIKLEPEVNLL